jgi:hypothetical protein
LSKIRISPGQAYGGLRSQKTVFEITTATTVEPMVESRTGKRAEHAGSTMLALSRSALALDGACLVA